MKQRNLLQRLQYAWSGVHITWRSESSFRIQLIWAVMVLAVMGILQPATIWWAVVGLSIALVLGAELINTALENLSDHLHPELHPRIKIVKDCAAAAVLVLGIGALWVGILMVLSALDL